MNSHVIRLNSIIETAIDGIITIDDRGYIESINPAAARLFGYKAEELIGKKINVLMPMPHRKEHDKYLHRYQSTGDAHIIGIGREVEGLKKDGNTFPFRLAVSETILEDQTIYTGIIHDLTEVKAMEQKLIDTNNRLEDLVESRTQDLENVVNELLKSNRLLEESQTQLEEALAKERELNELKSRFVSMASHEFRTPLSTILSSASLISKYVNEEHQEKRLRHINRIKSSVDHLTNILNDFLSLGKLEEGKIALQYTQIDIVDLCSDINEELKGLLKPGQHIDKIINGTPYPFHSDLHVLKGILFNLLSNAIKYSNEHQPISCIFRFSPEQISIAIADRGVGIPREDQEHLFTRFFRANNVENIQGTGLGLSIVKRYVDLLGGTITFESEVGRGSTFTVDLPSKA